MKNFLTYLFIISVTNFSIMAQSQIEGNIMTEEGEMPNRITVSLINQHQSELHQNISTDEEGYFFVNNVADGAYKLVVEAPNYESIVISNIRFPQDNDQVFGLTLEKVKIITAAHKKMGANPIIVDNKLLTSND